jgi:hypothetical protein
LGEIGGERARDKLLACLTQEKDPETFKAIKASLDKGFGGDPLVQKTLKETPPPQPPPGNQVVPPPKKSPDSV